MLIVTDLDGTLLRRDATLSPATADILARLPVPITCATARSPAKIPSLTSAVRFTAPIVSLNGAVVLDPTTFDVAWEHALARDTVEELVRVGLSVGCAPFLVGRDDGREVLWYDPSVTDVQRSFLAARQDEPRLAPVHPLRPPEHTWLALFFTANPGALAAHLPDHVHAATPDTYVSGAYNVDVRHERADKGSAVAEVARSVGADEIIAFGDQLNDLPLFERATWKVAVANAHPALQARADEICGSNDEDGVARWLERRFLR